MGLRRTQKRSGFAPNPKQTSVRDKPRANLGSRRTLNRADLGSRRTQTQSRFGFASNLEQTWVRVEPKAEQSKLGFATNPYLLWVRREPRAKQTWVRDKPRFALGSSRTQSKSRFLMNPVMAKLMRGKGRKNGWKWWTNPDRLWVPHEPSHGQADEREGEEK
ncbi:hypothetical protein SLEP1_g19935 [Rubroshorea leprosula]|uniref:Uncharacterized protein n=1 Tax=Rubroshorea leprosula TaxID=152421 RepID=A0AAV5JBM9_9ROSI|nr:hypothetical protein SLEP1_g19935 [Rubroshorea leprosula]